MDLHNQEHVLDNSIMSEPEKRQQMETRDPVSGVPLAFLSIATRYTFPDDFLGLELHGNVSKLKGQPWVSVVSDNTVITGSTREGLNLPVLVDRGLRRFLSIADVDIMIHFNLMDYFCVETQEEHPSLNPGFCYLRITEDEDAIVNNVTPFMHHYTKYNEGYYIGNTFFEERVSMLLMESLAEKVDNWQYDEPGPKMFRPAFQIKKSGRDADIVLSFVIPWPRQAFEWESRRRRSDWPSKELVNDCIRFGCHVVNKAYPFSNRLTMEWRFSFSRAERDLAQSLTNSQRMCYRVFKALIKLSKNGANEGLASYYLKTTLFWVCEEVPSSHWNTSNLGSLLLCLLDKLLHFLTRRYLPNYFIPQANLIGGITGEVIQRWTEFILSIRKEPLGTLVQFHTRYQMGRDRIFPSDNVGAGIACLDILSKKELSLTMMASHIIAVLEVMGIYYACEYDHEMTLSVAKLIYFFTCKPGHRLTLNDNFEMGQNEELFLLITLYSVFIEKVIDDKVFIIDPLVPRMFGQCKREVLAIMCAERACFHYSLSQSLSLSESIREENLQHAWNAFGCAVGFGDQPVCVDVQYAQFLMTQNLHEDALDLLKDTVSESSGLQDEETMESIHFCRYTIDCLDEFLRDDVLAAASKNVRYSDQILAYYLIMRCYSELKTPEDEYEVPSVSLFPQRETGREKIAVEIELHHLEGCFCLSTGHVCEALYLFILARDKTSMKARPRIWYCVARLYLELLPKVQFIIAEHRKQYSVWPLKISNH